MELKNENAMLLVNLVEGPKDAGITCLLLVFETEGHEFRHAYVGCQSNQVESIQKTFQRLVAIKPPGWGEWVSQGGSLNVEPKNTENPENTENGEYLGE